ncbi:MAG: glucose-1-phosphate cytidylyltransferase [Gaiellaceae bacterium]
MKVVIFCGGLGVRMGEETQRIPKPMARIGNRPILWHIMRYYADWGHTEFILCLGYKGDSIKEYFLTHNEALTSDFVLEGGGPDARIELLTQDSVDWRITFVDTRLSATIGERLKAVEPFIGEDNVFLATYGDGLTDAPLPKVIDAFRERNKLAMFLSVVPQFDAHLVSAEPDGTVTRIEHLSAFDVRMNGGFFVFEREILDWIRPGDELVEETFARLLPNGEVVAYRYDGFFRPMDTIKDRQNLEALHESGNAPWIVTRRPASGAPAPG